MGVIQCKLSVRIDAEDLHELMKRILEFKRSWFSITGTPDLLNGEKIAVYAECDGNITDYAIDTDILIYAIQHLIEDNKCYWILGYDGDNVCLDFGMISDREISSIIQYAIFDEIVYKE